MKEKRKSKGIFITIGIAVTMVALSITVLTTLLAHAAQPNENTAYSENVKTVDLLSTETNSTEGLNMLIYLQGQDAPTDGITAQYATSIVSEMAERVYNKPLKGRVFITLSDTYGNDTGLFWNVNAEVEGGAITATVDCKTGVDRMCRYFEMEDDWLWFDNWNEQAAEEERLSTEKDFASSSETSGYSDEELSTLYEMKRNGMLEFSASMAGTSYGAKAIEIVNSKKLGDGAKALSAAVMMGDADPGYCTYYVLEVQLDNGKYIMIDLTAENMEILGYQRCNTTLAQALYG